MNHTQLKNSDFREELQKSIGSQPYRMWFDNAEINKKTSGFEIKTKTKFAATWIDQNFKKELIEISSRHGRTKITIDCDNNSTIRNIIPDEKQKLKTKILKRDNFLKFENYIVGACNQIAFGAAQAMASSKTHTDLLVIYGSCGVGKSHLLQASTVLAKELGEKSKYLTGEKFTNDFISSIKSGRLANFRNQYRNIDLLVIDDVHFIAGKDRTREEFLHTLDALQLSGQKVILATDSHPKEILQLSDSLRSRMLGGLVLSIELLDKQTLKNIATTVGVTQGLKIDSETLGLLSEKSPCSAREIIGCITKLAAIKKLDKNLKNMSLSTLLKQTEDIHKYDGNLTLKQILDGICSFFNITIDQLKNKSRNDNLILARSIFTYIARTKNKASFPEIARALDRKHHGSLLNASKKLKIDIINKNYITYKNKKQLVKILVEKCEEAALKTRY